MEPLSVTVATLIATYAAQAFGGQLGQAAAAGVKNLVSLVRRKLAGNEAAQAALATAQGAPGTTGPGDLAGPLDAAVRGDAEFRARLEDLVAALQADPDIGQFVTTVSGNARVGKITNIGSVTGNVTF